MVVGAVGAVGAVGDEGFTVDAMDEAEGEGWSASWEWEWEGEGSSRARLRPLIRAHGRTLPRTALGMAATAHGLWYVEGTSLATVQRELAGRPGVRGVTAAAAMSEKASQRRALSSTAWLAVGYLTSRLIREIAGACPRGPSPHVSAMWEWDMSTPHSLRNLLPFTISPSGISL